MKFTINIRKQSQIGYMFVLTFYCFHIDSSTERLLNTMKDIVYY